MALFSLTDHNTGGVIESDNLDEICRIAKDLIMTTWRLQKYGQPVRFRYWECITVKDAAGTTLPIKMVWCWSDCDGQ